MRHFKCLAVAAITLCMRADDAGAQVVSDPTGNVKSKPPAATPADAARTGDSKTPVPEGDRLSFDQSKVAAEMNELEERMFRLADALKAVEPENSSRLMIALKNAREELILHQMKDTQELLRKLELGQALTEEKQLLAKLQRLHDLLLSMDLDFQMRLERLRLVREILQQLDKAIKEEDREQKRSRDTAAAEKELADWRQRQKTLEELVKRQKAHVDQGTKLAKLDAGKTEVQNALGELGKDQQSTRTDTQSLAEQDAKAGSKSENLTQAEGRMGQATESLKDNKPSDAVPLQEQALDALKRELGRTVEELKRREKKLERENFAEMQKDQQQNRRATDGISESTRKLGDDGARALSELIRAGGKMSSAEDELGRERADPASAEQDRALQSLKYARDELAQVERDLLEGLRGEVKRRVLEALTIMLEKQIAVRESTELLGPKVASGSREALTAVAGLSKSEERIIDLANESIGLVEETEFGIALPAALRVVRRSMVGVKNVLAKGDASPPVVEAEKQIESDLKSLLDAMKHLPTTTARNSNRNQPSEADQERERNRLIAELKMIRLLQVRVNGETIDVDSDRPSEEAELSQAIRKAIAGVEGHQDEVREATERLAAGQAGESGQ